MPQPMMVFGVPQHLVLVSIEPKVYSLLVISLPTCRVWRAHWMGLINEVSIMELY